MQKALRYAVLAGIFAIPFIPFVVANQLFFPFITGKNFAFRIIVEVVFGLWLILTLQDPSARPKKSGLWFALLLFVASLGISTFIGENPQKSFWSNFERMEGWITLLHFGAYFTVLVSMLKDEKNWKWLWNVSIFVSVLVGLYGVSQLAGIFTINQGGARVDATFGNATYLAVYMLFHVFMTLYALVKWRPTRWVQVGYGFAIVLQVLMIFYAATRGTTLGLLGGLLLAGLIFALFGKGHRTVRRGGIALIVGVLVIAAGFYAIKDTAFVQNDYTLRRFADIDLQAGQTRFTIWNMALKGASERPIFGWGQENFNYIFNKDYKGSMYGQEPWFDRAHNQFLDWVVAGGSVGLILYLALYAFALWYLWRGDSFDVSERAILTGVLAGYAFHNLFVFDNLMSSVLFLMMLAFITVRHTREKSEIALPTLSGGALSAASGVIVVALVATVYFVNVPGIVRAAGIVSAISPHDGGLQTNFDIFKKVIQGGGLGQQEAYEQLIQFATQIRRQDLQQLSTPELRDEVATYTKDNFIEEINRHPEDARLRVFYGSFLRQIGDLADAKVQLNKALELSPEKQSIMFELGLIATLENDGTNAVMWFKKAYELAPSYDQARMLYVSILIRVGDTATADQLLLERFGTVTPPNDVLLQAYYDLKIFDRAVAVAQARITEDPTDPNRYTQLAAVYVEAGNRAQAIVVLQQAGEALPSFKTQADQFIQQIQSGQI